MRKISLIVLMVFCFFGCNKTEEKLIEKFKHDSFLFENFRSFAVNDKTLTSNIGKLIKPENLQSETKESLGKLGLQKVSYVILNHQNCPESVEPEIEVIFNGDWHLEYWPCEKNHIREGSHDKNGFIESWGLNKNWILWANNDFIG